MLFQCQLFESPFFTICFKKAVFAGTQAKQAVVCGKKNRAVFVKKNKSVLTRVKNRAIMLP